MKAVIQRVTEASVTIDGQVVGEIGHGILLLLGVCPQDGEKEAAWLADKVVNLRIFTDNEDKMNLSLMDVGGEMLVVSQFTLYGDCKKGRRPSYTDAARLTIDPAPDTLIRVFLAWKGLEEPVEVPPQGLTAPERTGFTAVEWGGAEVIG